MEEPYESLYELENFEVDLLDNYHYCREAMMYDIANEYVKNQSVLTEASIVNIIKTVINRVITFIKTQALKLFDLTKKVFTKSKAHSKKMYKERREKVSGMKFERKAIPVSYQGFNFMGLFDKFEELKGVFNDSIESCKDYTSDIDTTIFTLIFKRSDSDNLEDKVNRSYDIAKRKIQSSIKNTFGVDSLDSKDIRKQIAKFIAGEEAVYKSDTKTADTDFYKFNDLYDKIYDFFDKKVKRDIDKEISALKDIEHKVSREGLFDYQKTVTDDKGNDITRYHNDYNDNVSDIIVEMLGNVQRMMNDVIVFSKSVAFTFAEAILKAQGILANMSCAPEAFPAEAAGK